MYKRVILLSFLLVSSVLLSFSFVDAIEFLGLGLVSPLWVAFGVYIFADVYRGKFKKFFKFILLRCKRMYKRIMFLSFLLVFSVLLGFSFVGAIEFLGLGLGLVSPLWIAFGVYIFADVYRGKFKEFFRSLLQRCKSWLRPIDSNSNSSPSPSFIEEYGHYDYAIYFDAPKGSQHHVMMWLPYLSQVSDRFVIILRSEKYRKIFRAEGFDVKVVKKIRGLELLNDLGVKCIFYVNNGMRNTHAVRYANISHVQLLHGDSDKPPSFNPITAMYDHVCVAGQLGRDRYVDNGVSIPDEKFSVVSRPQVKGLRVVQNPSSIKGKVTVFYATTWSGFHSDADFTTIHQAYELITQMLDRGYRVIFRPHPYSYENAEQLAVINKIKKLFHFRGVDAGVISNHPHFNEVYPGIEDCINASDLMLSDVTSVLSDWLYTLKPYIVMTPHARDEFIGRNKLITAAYLIDPSLVDFDRVLTSCVSSDKKYSDRVRLREYVLGVKGGECPEKLFVEVLSKIVFPVDVAESQPKLISQL